jgi:hypothetical protein
MSGFEARPVLSFAGVACVVLALASCAKEAGSQPDVPQPDYAMQGAGMPPQQGAPGPGMPGAPPAQTWDGPAKRPKRLRDVSAPIGTTAATGAATASTTATAPAPTATSTAPAITPAELFRAQDACLDHCDQFACMKIAQAYKAGAGVPADPLAGRRYALHACLECGSPGLAIVDQCPSWGIEGEPKKKTK